MSIESATSRARSTSLWGMTAIAVVKRFPGIGIASIIGLELILFKGKAWATQPASHC